jgi:gas vesicle protein
MNKLWKGMLFGALAGGAVSLFDRDTRQAVTSSCKKGAQTATYYIKHPNEAVTQVKETTQKIRTTIEQVSEDVSFISGQVEELKGLTPAVKDLVEDTKEVFTKDKEG